MVELDITEDKKLKGPVEATFWPGYESLHLCKKDLFLHPGSAKILRKRLSTVGIILLTHVTSMTKHWMASNMSNTKA